jgi:hypothetical protein
VFFYALHHAAFPGKADLAILLEAIQPIQPT